MTGPHSISFHGYYDTRIRPHGVFQVVKGWRLHSSSKHTNTEDRHLRYRFYLHAHPYVADLISKLV